MHRLVLVPSLICCFKRRCLEKSDRIGIEMCYVLHCAAVQRRLKQQISEGTRTRLRITIQFVLIVISSLQYDLICPDNDRLYAL